MPWWNNTIDNTQQWINEKIYEYIWQKYLGNSRNEDDYQKYKTQREKLNIMVKKTKAKSWEEFEIKMEKDSQSQGN